LRNSTAEWVVLLDVDDEPSDEFLETIVRAQAGSNADVVTCGMLVRDGAASKPYYFLGDPAGLGALSNAYGVAPLIRRSLLADRLAGRGRSGLGAPRAAERLGRGNRLGSPAARDATAAAGRPEPPSVGRAPRGQGARAGRSGDARSAGPARGRPRFAPWAGPRQ